MVARSLAHLCIVRAHVGHEGQRVPLPNHVDVGPENCVALPQDPEEDIRPYHRLPLEDAIPPLPGLDSFVSPLQQQPATGRGRGEGGLAKKGFMHLDKIQDLDRVH